MLWDEVQVADMTEEGFLSLGPDDRLCELKNGMMIVYPPATREHQDVVALLVTLFNLFLARHRTDELMFGRYPMRLVAGLLREPDLVFVVAARAHLVTKRYLDCPADLVIEIVSDSWDARNRDLEEKRDEYELHGVGEYWAVDLEEGTIHVHRREGEKFAVESVRCGKLVSTACPGFWIDVGWVLSDLPANAITCLVALMGPNLSNPSEPRGEGS